MKPLNGYSCLNLDDAKKMRGSLYSIESRYGNYMDWLIDGLEIRLARQYMKTGSLVFVVTGKSFVERVRFMHPQTKKRLSRYFGRSLPDLTGGKLSTNWFVCFTEDSVCVGLTANSNSSEWKDMYRDYRAAHEASKELIQAYFCEDSTFYTSTLPL